jgi:DNA-binding HxlR family transcriptional regulator
MSMIDYLVATPPAMTLDGVALCPVEPAARIIGQKWTLQIVYYLLDGKSVRFCELQDELGGVNPSTLSSRLKMLEEEGLVQRTQISAIPPHVQYSLTDKGRALENVIRTLIQWCNNWYCRN